jgi:hypothetical protein
MLQNVPDKIMVFIEPGKVVMTAAMNSDQGDLPGIELL